MENKIHTGQTLVVGKRPAPTNWFYTAQASALKMYRAQGLMLIDPFLCKLKYPVEYEKLTNPEPTTKKQLREAKKKHKELMKNMKNWAKQREANNYPPHIEMLNHQ